MDMESDLVEEVLKILEEVCIILEGIRKSLDKDDKRPIQVSIPDQEQRQPQNFLHDTSARIALARNKESSTKLGSREKCPELLDDSEATHGFQLIYEELKSWVDRHYTRLSFTRNSDDAQSSHDYTNHPPGPFKYCPDTLHMIHGEIFERLFTSILAPFIVGTSNVSLDHHMRLIDKEVQQLCPAQVWQNWRSVLSTAISSHGKESLERTRDGIMHRTEAKFGQMSTTGSKERQKELREIVWKCLEFKKKLECQGNLFYFWWSPPGAALREERMVSITEQYPTNGKVGRTLWPMFYRQLPDEWVILAKEVVITSPGHQRELKFRSSHSPEPQLVHDT
ncbi:hypothetical protein N7533_008237 [Penicillium manginii]|uniref:uncharacterized protein n=1 Tax=Penicillium manginii TaxID=203109 RepID=UPI0025495827|nr:uncharacterized protein N7533_008237 [Penicillium manginii]KAJ5751209.1 hypothetical protein N7533_008237 [Penicillium manginii]